ncbi:MAG: uncharacterized protein JWN07_2181 [Hyphomicrobiales bacterium]|nr:uncharacterized protein [Hyphomicrobiales bacterium]
MKSLSLARVLPVMESFGSPRPQIARLDPLIQEAPRPELHVVESVEPWPAAAEDDPAERDQHHFQEGYESGFAVGRAQAQAEIIDHDVLLRDAVAAARAEWLGEESERIAVGVEKALAYLQGEICTVATRVLAQITSEVMRERTVSEFCASVAALLRDGKAGVVTIHAPDDLIGRLESRLASLGTLEFVAHDSAEVWVRCGATMIETRFDAWRSEHFKGA